MVLLYAGGSSFPERCIHCHGDCWFRKGEHSGLQQVGVHSSPPQQPLVALIDADSGGANVA